MRKNVIIAFLVVGVAFGINYWRQNSVFKSNSQAGAAIVKVILPELDLVQTEGKALFDAKCANCHGANAAGQDGVAPPLVHIIYETGHHSDMAFVRAALQGVRSHHWPFGDMPPVDDITEEEIIKIIAYVRALQRENSIF